MIWGLPAFFVSFLIYKGMLFGNYPPNSILEWLALTAVATLFCVIPFMVCGGFAAIIGTMFDTHPVESTRYKLVTIRDKDGMKGQFFLGTGMIESNQYYFFYKKNSDGSVSPDKVEADSGVRVYEEDRKDAELVVYEWVLKKSWAYLVAIPVNDDGWSYKFHVPKGTVRTGFTM